MTILNKRRLFDLWDHSQVPSKGSAKYMLTFIDNYSRKVWIYTIKSKDEVFRHFKQWKTLIEKLTSKKDFAVSSSDRGIDVGTSEQVELELNSHDLVQPQIDHFPGLDEE